MAADRHSALRRFWSLLRNPGATFSPLALLLVGVIGGMLLWGGFHAGIEITNSTAFCTTCHEMRNTVFAEYQQTIHYSNRTGVRVGCSDCHVPHAWGPMMVRKVGASKDIWGKLTGVIDTPAKFEANRMRLATAEWKRMEATDSRECRSCHSFDAMSAQIQKQSVYKKHIAAQQAGKTCIDCHKGIAHHLPKEYRDPDEEA